MMRHVREVAVLGAGTMGAQIAAHFANAGIPALLLDITRDVAREGLDRARALRPDPFFTPTTHTLIKTGSFDQDLGGIAKCDWILEAVVERLDIKQALLAKIESHRRADAIVGSNTSGIPIAALAEGRSAGFKRHFLGTHFFNPPRYLHLLEIIPTAETDPAVVDAVLAFADRRLGKGVVVAKDTPNFIANHIQRLAGRRARPSGPWTSRVLMFSRTLPETLASDSGRPTIDDTSTCHHWSRIWSAAAGSARSRVRASTKRRLMAKS